MSNELKANIADAQKFFDKTKCTSFAEVMVQYANSRPTEPKTKIAESIKLLKDCSRYIEPIMTEGSCYKFHLFLKSLYPNAIPVLDSDHVVSSIDGVLYDINGIVEPGAYLPMGAKAIEDGMWIDINQKGTDAQNELLEGLYSDLRYMPDPEADNGLVFRDKIMHFCKKWVALFELPKDGE